MITGRNDLQLELEALPYQFHLTGSRAFGGYRSDSDYDYFCANSPDVQEALYKLGYENDDFSSYETASVVLKKRDIHIQLVDNFNLKLSTQNEILSNPLYLILIRSS